MEVFNQLINLLYATLSWSWRKINICSYFQNGVKNGSEPSKTSIMQFPYCNINANLTGFSNWEIRNKILLVHAAKMLNHFNVDKIGINRDYLHDILKSLIPFTSVFRFFGLYHAPTSIPGTFFHRLSRTWNTIK